MTTRKVLLIVCGIIMAIFVLLVAIASNLSLSFHTIPHVIVLASIWKILHGDGSDSTVSRLTIVFAILGAILAIYLVYLFLPYYMTYSQYVSP